MIRTKGLLGKVVLYEPPEDLENWPGLPDRRIAAVVLEENLHGPDPKGFPWAWIGFGTRVKSQWGYRYEHMALVPQRFLREAKP